MYLEKRRRRWYAAHDIPADLRPTFDGKKRFFVSLGTEDKREAKRRAAIHEQRWLREIERARDAASDPLERDALYWKALYNQAETDAEQRLVASQIEDIADEMVRRAAMRLGAVDERQLSLEELPEHDRAVRFYKTATGQLVRTEDRIEEWLATKTDLKDKQRDMYRSDLKRFAKKFPHVEDVSRKEAAAWVNGLMGTGGLKRKTVQRILASIRGYWSYLRDLEIVPEDSDPFRGLAKPTKNGSNGRSSARLDKWLPFEPEAVVKLLSAAEAKGDTKLADLIRLGMWTGCRIEELCSLKVPQVHSDHFEVLDAKTPAGWRKVPIHSQLGPVLERLTRESEDGYVLQGLTVNKYGDRSNAIGKRFGRLKIDAGYGERFVFHSIRKCVVTQLERAGVPENVTADIVGHDKPTMTYGVYSGGNDLETLRKAMEKLCYPIHL
jgi:integrase